MKPAAVPAVLALMKNGVNMKPNISCNKQIGHQTLVAYSSNVKIGGFFQFRETWSIIVVFNVGEDFEQRNVVL